MSYDVGAKIGIEGEKEFKNAITSINSNLKLLNSELKASASSFDKNDKSVKNLTAQNAVLSKSIDAQKIKVAELQKMVEKSSQTYGEGSVQTQKYKKELNDATAALNKAELQHKNNEKAIKNHNAETVKATMQSEEMRKAQERLGNTFRAVAVAVGVVITATAAFAKKGIELASDLDEVQNVVDVTFGDGAEKINQWAIAAAEGFGMSELQAKKFNGTIGAMLKSMGLTDSAVLNMSTSLAGLAGDFASFYNLDAEEAFNKIRSGISGETEPLKQLGINMSVANLEAYRLSQGITVAYEKMNEASKATLRYNYLMSVSKDAQGDFSRTSDSFANQQRILKLEIENLSAALGKQLLPVLNELMPQLIDFVQNFDISKITNGFQWFIDNGKIIISTAVAIGAGMVTWNVAQTIYAVVQAIQVWRGAMETAKVAQIGLNVAMASNPIGLVITVLATLTAGLIAYKMMAGQAKSASQELYAETKKLSESYAENKKAIENSEAADLAKMDTARDLANELYDLNEQLKNGTLSEEDAIATKERMHSISDQLRRLMPDVALEFDKETGILNTQRGEVEKLIDSYIRLAKAKAAQAKIEEAEKSRLDALVKKRQIESAKAGAEYNLDYLGNPYEMSITQGYSNKEIQGKRALWSTETKRLEDYNNSLSELASNLESIDYDIATVKAEVGDLGIETEKTTEKVGGLGNQFNYTAGASKDSAKSTAKAEKELTKELEQQRDKRFKDLKYNLDMGQITEQQYYNGLETLRDTYFAKGTDEYQKYTQDIFNYQKGILDKITQEFKTKFSEIDTARKALESKFKGSTSLFSSQKVRIKEGDNTTEFENNSLTNFGDHVKKLSKYNELLQSVKNKGITLGLVTEIFNMSMDDAIKYMELLLSTSDTDYQSYLLGWQSYQNLAESSALGAYSDQVDNVKKKYVDKLSEMLGGLTTNYEGYGMSYAQAIGAGFTNSIDEVFTGIRNQLQIQLKSLNALMGGYTLSGGTVNNSTYAPTIVLQNPSVTPSQALKAAANQYIIDGIRGLVK